MAHHTCVLFQLRPAGRKPQIDLPADGQPINLILQFMGMIQKALTALLKKQVPIKAGSSNTSVLLL